MSYISIGQNRSRGTISPGGYQAIGSTFDDSRLNFSLGNKTSGGWYID